MKFSRIFKASTCATLASVFAISLPLAMTAAQAETFTKREFQNKDRCFEVRKVAALIEFNTRGIKLRSASRSWQGNMQRHGALVVNKHHDPVFIQTKRTLEEQHTTLIPVGC